MFSVQCLVFGIHLFPFSPILLFLPSSHIEQILVWCVTFDYIGSYLLNVCRILKINSKFHAFVTILGRWANEHLNIYFELGWWQNLINIWSCYRICNSTENESVKFLSSLFLFPILNFSNGIVSLDSLWLKMLDNDSQIFF